jgi:anti-sigma factor RsiW
MRCDEATPLLGSYALGGLEAREVAELEEHLGGCAACRRALERVAPLPRLLDSLDPDQSGDAAPPRRLEGAVLAGFAAAQEAAPRPGRRRRWSGSRWPAATAGALAGSVATAAVLAVAGGFSSEPPGEVRVTLVAPSGAAAATAHARLVGTGSGTAIDLQARLPALRAGEVYELWFAGERGVVSAGTFTVDARGRADVRLTCAARPASYERLGITREPDGYDPARNGPGVVAARLAG